MAQPQFANFRDYLFWQYASMQMLFIALKRGLKEYDRYCYASRAKFFKGYKEGHFAPTSLVDNVLARVHDASACWYCGREGVRLTRDHILPLSKGGPDTADNVALVCQRCNSSKRDTDLMEWYCKTFGIMPPLYLWASYLKLVHQYAVAHELMDMHRPEMEAMTLPFNIISLSLRFHPSDYYGDNDE